MTRGRTQDSDKTEEKGKLGLQEKKENDLTSIKDIIKKHRIDDITYVCNQMSNKQLYMVTNIIKNMIVEAKRNTFFCNNVINSKSMLDKKFGGFPE